MEEQEYTVVATSLKLVSWWKLPRFLRLTNRVGGQLKKTPGVVSHRLKADFLGLRFSTISIWESEDSIGEIVNEGAHQIAMQAFFDVADVVASRFVRWKTADLDGGHLAGSFSAPFVGRSLKSLSRWRHRLPLLIVQLSDDPFQSRLVPRSGRRHP